MLQFSENSKMILAAVSSLIAVGTHIKYILNVLRGLTKPHAFSWLVWAILTGIGFAGQIAGGGGPGAWVTGIMCVICTTIFLLAIFRGEKNITYFDIGCLCFGLAAIPLWVFTADPLWSIILVTLIDLVAFAPTMRKSYFKPFEETALAYTGNLIKWLLAIFALNTFSVTTALYPASLILSNSLFIFILLFRRSTMAKTENNRLQQRE